MVYKQISSAIVIGKVIANFNPTSDDWIPYAPQWINDCINDMQLMTTAIIAEPKTLHIIGQRIKLPCDLITLIAIIGDDGFRLPTITQINLNSTSRRYKAYQLHHSNIVWFNYDDADVTIHYTKRNIDTNLELGLDFPMIPDNDILINAITYYIIKQMLLKGYKHPVFDIKSNNPFINPALVYATERKRARNAISSFDADAREEISRLNRTLLANLDNHFIANYKPNTTLNEG